MPRTLIAGTVKPCDLAAAAREVQIVIDAARTPTACPISQISHRACSFSSVVAKHRGAHQPVHRRRRKARVASDRHAPVRDGDVRAEQSNSELRSCP